MGICKGELLFQWRFAAEELIYFPSGSWALSLAVIERVRQTCFIQRKHSVH